ncbi:tyrosine-type recombinase/integrase [Occallatibacter savannae]|uniref:tyrosine-type recombinase/integrase n=1 Tax=Occallatibacter savannae TaxID=1002691 RepID=UPI000D68F89D|nr:site-specific integrase [Occallatibacter savannae]
MTLNEYLDRWLHLAARPRLRAKSYADYAALLARYIRPSLGGHTLQDLKPLEIQATYQSMLDRKLSPRTIQYTHSVLHAALEQAVRWGQLAQNPANGLALPKIERKIPRVLTVDEARRFLRAALETRYGAVFALALTSGLRPSELVALRYADIDWLRQTVTIERALVKGKGWQFQGTKRPASRRQVKLHNWVLQLLRAKRQETVPTVSGADPGSCQIFQTLSGQPLNSDYLGRELKRILAQAGLPRIRLYDLRHTAASLALAAHVPAKVISEQLGHTTVAFTLDRYAHLLPHLQTEAAERVEALLAIAPGHRKPPVSIHPHSVVSVTA